MHHAVNYRESKVLQQGMEPAGPSVAMGVDHEVEDAVSLGASTSEPFPRGAAAAGSYDLYESEDANEKSNLEGTKLEDEKHAATQKEQKAVGISNGFTVYEERKRQQRDHEVQLAIQMADAVEDDAHAVARSLTGLLSSLKSALSEVTTSSVANMQIENEAAGQVQDAAIDAASKGNRFINACLRLNEEMKGMERVASQLQALKVKVDQVESQASRYLSR